MTSIVAAREYRPQPAKTSTQCVNVGSQVVAPPRVSRDKESLLKEELTVDNYKEKFCLLLEVEEQEHRMQLTERYIYIMLYS